MRLKIKKKKKNTYPDETILSMLNLNLGRYGEKLAKDFLIRHGYEIVDAHWQKRVGEIDIIALDPKTNELIFTEVKTRQGTSFGYPEERVDKKKLAKITKTAQWFLLTNQYPAHQHWQIDVISIIINPNTRQAEITHFKNISTN
jgi:putative endonuclease